MSFTTDVKAQIAGNELRPCCMKAQLTAIIQMCSTLNFTSQGMHITMKTENATTAKRMLKYVKELYDVETQLSVIKKNEVKKEQCVCNSSNNKSNGNFKGS